MELSKKETKKALDNSTIEGSVASAKSGFCNHYIIPFALALGAGDAMVGLLASVPQLLGTLFFPLSGKIIDKYKNKKIITIFFATAHRLIWIPIALLPMIIGIGETALFILLVSLSFMLLFKAISVTAWTSWIMDIVPDNIRGRYFGKRNFFVNLSFLLAIVVAGLLLDNYSGMNGFVLIFSIGTVIGLLSTYFLVKIPESKMVDVHNQFHFSFKHFIHGIKEHKNHSNFVMFMVAAEFSRYLVAPFLMVLILRDLGIGYFWFSIIYATYMLSTTLFQIYWGKFSDKYGHRKTLKISYIMLPLIPILILFVSSSLPLIIILLILLVAEFFDGFVTSGFSLSSFNYLLESIPKEESHLFVANYRFLTGLAIAVAYFIGGLLATYFEGQTFLWMSGIQLLFLVSILLRIILPLPFLSRFHSIIHTKPVKYKKLFIKAITDYPMKELTHELSMLTNRLNRMRKSSSR